MPVPSRMAPPPPRQRPTVPAPPQPVTVGMYDVHFTIGWRDDICRLTHPDYQKVVLHWQLGGEDVILRGRYEDHERTFLLRGREGGNVTVRAANPKVKLPQLQVLTIDEMKMALLTEREAAVRR